MRYELKMTFPETEYMSVLNRILSSSQWVQEIYHERRINNIYFDTPGFSDYLANLHGDSHRKKYRIRWYGDTRGEITSPTLELKYKKGLCGGKRMIALPKFQFDEHFDYSAYAGEVSGLMRTAGEQDCALLGELLQRNPVLYNNYIRRYFLTRDGKYRITMDKRIWYSAVPVTLPEINVFSKHDPILVLEVKFDEKDYAGAAALINEMGYRINRNSKYVNGIQATIGY